MTPAAFSTALDLLVQTTDALGARANQTDDRLLACAVTNLLRSIEELLEAVESLNCEQPHLLGVDP